MAWHKATHEQIEVEVPVLDEDGNPTGETTIVHQKGAVIYPSQITGSFQDDTITDADRLEDAWADFREERNEKLKHTDKYQGALFYNSLTSEQQTELAVYRQLLLAMPAVYATPQEAYENWPARPTWVD